LVFLFAGYAIYKIAARKEAFVKKGIKIVFLILLFVFLFSFYPKYLNDFRMNRAISYNIRGELGIIGEALISYSRAMGKFPEAERWSDLLIEYEGLSKNNFQIGQMPDVKCNLSFNKNLSNKPFGTLPGNVILLFEADGQLNLNGGEDLFQQKRLTEKYFLRRKDAFAHLYFVDGTIVRYRLLDGSVSEYDDTRNQYMPYTQKSNYLPLQWGKKGGNLKLGPIGVGLGDGTTDDTD